MKSELNKQIEFERGINNLLMSLKLIKPTRLFTRILKQLIK